MQSNEIGPPQPPCVYRGVCGGQASVLGLPFPTELSPDDKSRDLTLACKNLYVSYMGSGRPREHPAAVRANYPIPQEGLKFYYFEVTVIDFGTKGYIAMGMSGPGVNLEALPGWGSESYGYHRPGYIFDGSARARKLYASNYDVGDTVGMCWDMTEETVFFTKNGVSLGTAFEGVSKSSLMFPSVGLHSYGECVRVNFGEVPFKYDLELFRYA